MNPKLRRVTDLFESGTTRNVAPDGEEPVLVWVNKLNTFERGEAQRDASAARAARMLALTESSPEMALLAGTLAASDRDTLLTQLAGSEYNAKYLLALDEVRADPDWAERLLIIERGEVLADDGGEPEDSAGRAQIAEVTAGYLARLAELTDKAIAEHRAELAQMTQSELTAAYLAAYRDRLGSDAFTAEFAVTEVFFALRDCQAVPTEDAGWDHTKCVHQRLLPDRGGVHDLPDRLVEVVREALTETTMTPRDAGNSAAPSTSSGSSGQPSAPGASTPSTPAGR